jgi:transposase InsO family protein
MDFNQNKKKTVSTRHPMLSYHAGSSMELVHLDFIGPLSRTERGNEHILMMVDQFTKWVECIPLPSQSAEETPRDAVNQFFSRFGCPFQVFIDQGRNFESSLFREMCDLLHIYKSRTTPYRPSVNGQVERCNRTLAAAVRCFIGKNQRS